MSEELKDATDKLVEAVKEFAGAAENKLVELSGQVEPLIQSAQAKVTEFADTAEIKIDELRKKVHEATADPK